MTFGLANTIVLVVYITAMFAIGLYFSRRQKDSEEFFLAGRRMPWLPVALSMYASLTSATTYLVLPGMGYSSGTTMLIAAIVSPLVAPLLIACFYPAYRRMRITTSYEFIGVHHGEWARGTVALLFVLARLGWLGTVIYAPAMVLATVSGLPLSLSIAMMGLLATAYTALGGLGAVLWTDVVQFVILAGGAVWIAISLTTGIDGGVAHIIQRAIETDRINFTNWGFSLTAMTIPLVGLHFVLQMMQDYGTDQVTVQRLMAVKSDRGVFKAIGLNAVSDLVLISLLLFIGIALFAHYETAQVTLPPGLSNDAILPYYVMQALPAGISGLMITAIFAAAMSSMDSGIHSLATVVSSDIIPLIAKLLPSNLQVSGLPTFSPSPTLGPTTKSEATAALPSLGPTTKSEATAALPSLGPTTKSEATAALPSLGPTTKSEATAALPSLPSLGHTTKERRGGVGCWRLAHSSPSAPKPAACPAPQLSPTVKLARQLVILFGLLATATAFVVAAMGNILESFATFMSLFSAPVLVLFILTLLSPRTRFVAWLLATGLTIPATLWLQHLTIGPADAPVNWSLFYPFSFTTCLLLTLILNLFIPRKNGGRVRG